MLEPAGSSAHRDDAHCNGMAEQHGVLRVTVLSIAGSTDADAPPIGTHQSQLYCTCEIPGKPDSLLATVHQRWRPSESGFCLQTQCWKVEWNTTFEIHDFRRDDFLAFAVWAKDQSEHERKDGVDRLLGRTVMTSRTCSALTTKPGSPNQSHSLESDLPLAGTGTDSLAILAIRVSLDLPSEINKVLDRKASHEKQCQQRKSSNVNSDAVSESGTSIRSHRRHPSSAQSPGGWNREDSFLERPPSFDNMEEHCHLATVRRALRTELEVHTASFHRKILSALQDSEHRMTKTMYLLMGSPDQASMPRKFSSQRPEAPRKRSKDIENLSLSSAGFTASDGVGCMTRASSKTRTELSVDVDSAKTSQRELGMSHRRTSVQEKPTVASDTQIKDEMKKAPTESRNRRIPKDKIISMGHMDFMHTNMILQAEGLVSGPSSPTNQKKKSARRPSLEDLFGLTAGANDDASPSAKEAALSTDRKYKPDRSSGEGRARRAESRKGTFEQARSSLEASLKAISAEVASPSRRSRSSSRKSTADKMILQNMASIQSEVQVLPAGSALQPIPSLGNSGKDKLQRARGKLRFILAVKKAASDTKYASEQTSAEPSPDTSCAVHNSEAEVFDSEESVPPVVPTTNEAAQGPERALPLRLPVPLPGGIGDGSSCQTDKRTGVDSKLGVVCKLEGEDDASANIESQPTTIRHQEETPPSSPSSGEDSGRDEASEASTPIFKESESVQKDINTAASLLIPHSRPSSIAASQTSPIGRRGSSFCASQSMQILRRGVEETLLGHASASPEEVYQLNSDKAVKLSWLPTFMMSLSGILPMENCTSDLYFGFVLFLALASPLCSTQLVTGEDGPYTGVASITLAVGAFLGLVSMRRTNKIQHLLGPAAMPLERYAINHQFQEEWMTKSRRRFKWLTVAWVGVVLLYSLLPLVGDNAQCADEGSVYYEAGSAKWQAVLGPTAAFAYSSGLFLMLLYCQFHIVCFLELMLDSFCRRLFEADMLEEMVSEWNVRQAILRHAARTIENCFVIVQTCAFCSLVLAVFSVWSDARRACGIEWVMLALEHIPVLIVAVMALLLFCNAASVTEQCARVPSLVNSISLEDPVDDIRQYVVVYILNSDAGFYVRDVRLTAAMALKITYVVGAAGIGMLVHVFGM